VRCAEDPVLLEQVLNDRLLLPVDPAGEEENDKDERMGQRVHRASLPERMARRKAARFEIVRHQVRPSSGATSLLRLPTNTGSAYGGLSLKSV
jgi:hypothetical protein